MYKFNIIAKNKIWFSASTALVVLSLIFIFSWGLKFGIDFTGGSLLEVQFPTDQRPEISQIYDSLDHLELSSLIIQPTDNNGLILRFQETSEETHQLIMTEFRALADTMGEVLPEQSSLNIEMVGGTGEVSIGDIEIAGTTSNLSVMEELRFEAIGPSIGEELRRKAIYSMILVLLAIVAYVAWAFRKVSKPVASWKYGIAAIVALFHDMIIVLGLFSILGRFMSVEINSTFVAALLMVLGYSVNDTIVVFDRVRENLPKSNTDFEGTVNYSLNQTITRSINTSITTLLVLASLILLGGDSIHYFAIALFAGALVGTYSSIFLASPLLVWFEKIKK